MKNLVLSLSLIFSVNSFAKLNATDALKSVITNGSFSGLGENGECSVQISSDASGAVITIETSNASDTILVLNNSNKYFFNEETKEFKASQALNFPRYENGGTKYLFIKPINANEVVFSLSNALFEHNGNDSSTYLKCRITK